MPPSDSRARRPTGMPSSPELSATRPILPRAGAGDPAPPQPEVAAPAKRGRKPGPLSRAAREAQRRLNHSIIEKARRTKINDALATLRQLVPAEAGQPKSTASVDSGGEEDDGEYQPESSKPKKAGKKEEKEKEFKLEILVRTVAYMKELVDRVAELEGKLAQVPSSSHPALAAQVACSNCERRSKKRPRDEDNVDDRSHTRARRDDYDASLPQRAPLPTPPIYPSSKPYPPITEGPLPPISSWLADIVGDARLSPSPPAPASAVIPPGPRESTGRTPSSPSYLPSPPSSSRFDPVRSTHVPPNFNLGASNNAPSSSTFGTTTTPSPRLTAEDESAASLLMHMASRASTSPAFRPVPEASASLLPRRLSMLDSADSAPDKESMSGSYFDEPQLRTNVRPTHAETPASLLGIRHLVRP
jgi:Helix-loop-helix DNA-binding domain